MFLNALACGDQSDESPSSAQPLSEATGEPTPVDAPKTARFVVLGDGGTGEQIQYEVAAGVETVCGKIGCDFALYLGDNIYNSGVEDVDDSQFTEKFELPYQDLDFPFYVVLGNHDYGANGLGMEFWKARHQISYTAYSSKWTMPDRYYTFRVEPKVEFYGLDTNAILFGQGRPQEAWLERLTRVSPARWKIAFGHHPYISNGPHGNAGNYEGLPSFLPLVSTLRGDYMAEFGKRALCNDVDVYFSGHDHNRQWLAPKCGTLFVVSGSAAKLNPFRNNDNKVAYQNDIEPGFIWIEIKGDVMTGIFYNRFGTEQHRIRHQRT